MKRADLIRVGVFLLAALALLLLPRFISDFRAQQFAYVGIYFIALLGLNLLTGITGQISLGHGAFMLIGGYTTAILMSDEDPPLEILGHAFTGDMRDIWTIPIAGLVAGPRRLPLRLPRPPPHGPLPRARDVRDRRRGARGREEVRALHRRRHRDQPLRPRHPDAGQVDHRSGHLRGDQGRDRRARDRDTDVQRVALLPLLDARARHVRASPGSCFAAASAARFGPSGTASSPQPRPASTSRATRRSHSGSAPSTRASRARCLRSRPPSSTRTPSRSRFRSSCSSASSSAASARSGRSSSGRSSSTSCRSSGRSARRACPGLPPDRRRHRHRRARGTRGRVRRRPDPDHARVPRWRGGPGPHA